MNTVSRRTIPRVKPAIRSVAALYTSVGAFLTMAVIAAIAVASGKPLLFPSLGPTAFLLFASPLQTTACPRNTILGHLIGVLSGLAGLTLFGLLSTAPSLNHETWKRASAAAVAIGLTCAMMSLFELAHPPAGATTLIVALGILRTPMELVTVMIGVIVLTGLGALINRLAGVAYPLWRPLRAGNSQH